MVPRIDTEEEVDRAPPSVLFESLIEPLVSRIGRAPYLIFERLLYVIFSVGLDHKVASLRYKSEIRIEGQDNQTDKSGVRIEVLRVIALCCDEGGNVDGRRENARLRAHYAKAAHLRV